MNFVNKHFIIGCTLSFMLLCCTTNVLAQTNRSSSSRNNQDFDETYMRYQAKRQVQDTNSRNPNNKQKEQLNKVKTENKDLQKDLKQAASQIKALEKELQKTQKNLDNCSNNLADATYSGRQGSNKLQPGKNTYVEDDYDDYDDDYGYEDDEDDYGYDNQTSNNNADETDQMVEIRALEKRLQERKDMQKQQLDILRQLQEQLSSMNNN